MRKVLAVYVRAFKATEMPTCTNKCDRTTPVKHARSESARPIKGRVTILATGSKRSRDWSKFYHLNGTEVLVRVLYVHRCVHIVHIDRIVVVVLLYEGTFESTKIIRRYESIFVRNK